MITQPSSNTTTTPTAADAGSLPTGAIDRSDRGPAAGNGPAREGAGQTGGNGRERIHRVASRAHEAIDRLEQTLSSRLTRSSSSASGGTAQQARSYGEQVRHYGEQVRQYGQQARQYGAQARDRIHQQPLQSAGLAFAAGLLYSKVFMHKHKVHVVKVPVPVVPPEVGEWTEAGRGRAREWMGSANEGMHRLGESGQHAAKRIGAAAMAGAAAAKAMGSELWHRARARAPEDIARARDQGAELWHRARARAPHDMARARAQVTEKSQVYGTLAREQIQEHPLVGVAVALGVGALLSSLLMGRSRDEYGAAPAEGRAVFAVDKDGQAYGGEWVSVQEDSGMTTGTLVSAGVALGLGVLLGAMLTRR